MNVHAGVDGNMKMQGKLYSMSIHADGLGRNITVMDTRVCGY